MLTRGTRLDCLGQTLALLRCVVEGSYLLQVEPIGPCFLPSICAVASSISVHVFLSHRSRLQPSMVVFWVVVGAV
jgi:hypothetical protein